MRLIESDNKKNEVEEGLKEEEKVLAVKVLILDGQIFLDHLVVIETVGYPVLFGQVLTGDEYYKLISAV